MVRLDYNRAIVNKLSELIEANPTIRFGQLLIISGVLEEDKFVKDKFQIRDPFNEEPHITWNRMCNNKICFPNKDN